MTFTSQHNKSDERPGLIFLAVLLGFIAGVGLFYVLAYRSWDKRGEYWDDGRSINLSHSSVSVLPNGIWGDRYQMFGLLIHEEIHWSDHTEKHGLPGGYWPWVIVFGLVGSGVVGSVAWLMLYRR